MPASPATPSRSVLGRIRSARWSSGAPSVADAEDDRLEKRRATNRRSQQKSRDDKEALIRRLQMENALLKERLDSTEAASDSVSGTTARASSSYTGKSPPTTGSSPSTAYTNPAGFISVDLEACREAFIAVLASVCDPHLNTIHAVCQRFSDSRRFDPSATPHVHLHPPRPVDRPLNIHARYSTTQYNSQPAVPYNQFSTAVDFLDPANLFSSTTPPSNYIPSLSSAGPLTLPYLEPVHPVFNFELDCADIWVCVLTLVDMSRTDAEALASRLTGRIRCYGFGPVIMQQDVVEVCKDFPQLVPTPLDLVQKTKDHGVTMTLPPRKQSPAPCP